MKNQSEEYVLCAAILVDLKLQHSSIFVGLTHGNCLKSLKERCTQGFLVTSDEPPVKDWRFVDRFEAYQIARKAGQLASYKKKMEEAKVQFQIVKKTLPEEKDIPALLRSISQAGRDAGMEFILFQPKGEVNKKFYAEIPVAINVTGSYHNLALFFDKVANLSRIVNIRDINLNTSSAKTGELRTTCTAVTYRFIEG